MLAGTFCSLFMAAKVKCAQMIGSAKPYPFEYPSRRLYILATKP
jgi:hypothetical protein